MSVGILLDVGKSFTNFSSPESAISIDLDVTLDEVHEWQNDVTQNPVENGSMITDHIQIMPDKISIRGMISDSAISNDVIEEFSSVGGGEFLTRVQTHFDLLYQMMKDKKLVTVYTKYKIYTDMVLTTLSLPRSANIGDSINFRAEFVNVRLVDLQIVEVPNGVSKKQTSKTGKDVQNKTQPKKNAGKVATKEAPKKSTSILAGIL